jgi:hypothetical protein
MATPFYIQWQETTGGSGAFAGSSGDQPLVWQSLSLFRLNKNTSYQFHFSVNSAVTGDRFISLTEHGSQRIGVKLGAANGETNPVSVGPITLGDNDLKFMAALLGATDPKFPVTWGKGGQAKVAANWNGELWTIAINGTRQSGIDSFPVDNSDPIEFVIKDASRTKQWAALIVLPTADAIQSTILHETDLSTKSDHADTYTVTQPTGDTKTLFGLNLYDVLATTVLPVS